MIYIITVDAKQDYHQVTVYKLHKEKLAFLAPNNKNHTFKVVPFGPMNPPSFYTCIMSKLRIKHHTLFIVTLRKMKVFGSMTVRATNAYKIYLSGIKIFSDSKGITENILIWYINLKLIMIYFKCVCKVFEKIPRELQDLIVLIIKA